MKVGGPVSIRGGYESKTYDGSFRGVFDIVPHAESIADIGTDHGYLAVELIVRGKAKRVIAGDVHKGPLESAKSYVTSQGLSNVIDCRLGDGLQVTKKGELKRRHLLWYGWVFKCAISLRTVQNR